MWESQTKPLFYVTDYIIEILLNIVTKKMVHACTDPEKNAMYLS